jgi:hypothetical protein
MTSLANLLKDPPPAYAFELSEAGIAFARVNEPQRVNFLPFEAGVLLVSPVHDNIHQPQAVLDHIHAIAPPNGHRRRRAALILPDYCARIAVLDFDAFPSDPAEQLALLRFRLKKSVPFDVESAIVSYTPQPRKKDNPCRKSPPIGCVRLLRATRSDPWRRTNRPLILLSRMLWWTGSRTACKPLRRSPRSLPP